MLMSSSREWSFAVTVLFNLMSVDKQAINVSKHSRTPADMIKWLISQF